MKEHDHTEIGTQVRRIVISMIVSRKALSRIAPIWTGNNFAARWVNTIAGWCVDFYKKYGKAPNKDIETVFSVESEQLPEADKQIIESFLVAISGEHDRLAEEDNPEYSANLAAKHFTSVKQKRLHEESGNAIKLKDQTKFDELVNQYRKVNIGDGAEIDFFHDDAALEEALNPEKSERLVEFPGALGEFFGSAFSRNCFVSFLGREGLGKSWVLQEVAWQALLQRRKVAWFGCGDMSQDQMFRRMLSRIMNRPVKASTVRVPIDLRVTGSTSSEVVHEEQKFEKALGIKFSKRERDRILTEHLKTTGTPFRMLCYPAGILSIDMVESLLDQWAGVDWLPDVMIFDYADIMDFPKIRTDKQGDKINALWMNLRRIATQQHNCVVTATQANRISYTTKLIGMQHISDEKRKLSHVSSCFGMNQLEGEKEVGVMRFNYLKLRDDDYSRKRCAYTAGCLGIGNPMMLSAFPTTDELEAMSRGGKDREDDEE